MPCLFCILKRTCISLKVQKTADELAHLLSSSDYRVLSLGGLDHFILHARETIRVLESPVTFVDITRSLVDGPKVVEPPPLHSDFIARLSSKIAASFAVDGDQVIRVELDGVNGSTIFGVLLGYPVVYWYSVCPDGDESDGTCLDGREVVVCKTQWDSMDAVGALSFSYPKCLAGLLEPSIKSWADSRRVSILKSEENREKYAL